MDEKIYTIPVIDGFNENGECPFCNMYKSLEVQSVDFMLGPSYMEDDIRMDTNKKGFCQNHYGQMFSGKNRLGLSLMMHTHIQQINKDLEKLFSNKDNFTKTEKSFFKKATPEKQINNVSQYINNTTSSCYICDRIENVFKRYIDTFFYLWKKDASIKEYVRNSKGFCLEHFSLLIDKANKDLNKNQLDEFIGIIAPIQLENLKRIEEELDWFIKKFDYRFNDEPWKNSKDALQRAIMKISSLHIEE